LVKAKNREKLTRENDSRVKSLLKNIRVFLFML
jgi:hypothetical protein